MFYLDQYKRGWFKTAAKKLFLRLQDFQHIS
jgi:hypothetical protein